MDEVAMSAAGLDPEALRISRSLSRSFALHSAARAVEALAVAWLGCALVLAVSALSARDTGPQAWIVAGLGGVFAGAGFGWESRPRRTAHLRALDERLELGGALVTSAGVAARARSGSLAAALVRSVAARLGRGDLTRAAMPRTPLAILCALGGAALLFVAQDARASELSAQRVDAQPAAQALVGAAESLRSAARGAAPADASSASALAAAIDRAARDATLRPAGVAQLEQRVDLARQAAKDPSVERALDRARSALADARNELVARDASISSSATSSATSSAPTSAALDSDSASRSATGPGGDSGRGRDSVASALSSGPGSGSGALMARTSPEGRMSAPNAAGLAPIPASNPVQRPTRAERGVGEPRWWAPAYDAVVERWLAGQSPDTDH